MTGRIISHYPVLEETVTAGSGCTWAASSSAAWITITSGASGAGNGTFSYSVAADTSGTPKTGTLTLAGQTVTVIYDEAAPTMNITSPTTAGTCKTNVNPLSISGTATDDVAVVSVSWSNSAGGNGAASGAILPSAAASWSVSNITLQQGSNILTVTSRDTAGNLGAATLNVTYNRYDLNGDGREDVLDLQLLTNFILGVGTCSGNCDVNSDGLLNVLDLQKLIIVVMGVG